MIELFTDGGVCGPNPSVIGGTWAWVLVDGDTDEIMDHDSGFISPEDFDVPAITNNLSELFAALRGVEALPVGFNGRLYTDSIITLYRFTDGNGFNGVPPWLKERVLTARKNAKWQYDAILVGGHPTRHELRLGRRRDGKKVSKWNVWVDKKCKKLADKWKAIRGNLG